jgi:ketosteroid isomerase-like protein
LLAIAALAFAAVLVLHSAGSAGSATSPPKPEEGGLASAVGEIYKLQAAFHRAKTVQDIDLMMSLWDDDATLNIQGNPNSPFIGSAQIRPFWQTSGSFTHRRFSLVPSFKTQIDVDGDEAWLYFECHDVGDYDLPDRAIAADTFLAGTVRKVHGKWVFSNMTAGKAFPLSANHYYFP